MTHHSQDRRAVRRAPAGFLDAWNQLIGCEPGPTLAARRGRKPRVPLTRLLPALTFHVMQDHGTLGEHFTQFFDEPFGDSAWADRRARLPWEIFADLMQRTLRRRALRSKHADAFWRDWRLLAMDGTQFSLSNTPQVRKRVRKARTRRGRAAFAKMTTAVLLELGLHNPLAAAIAQNGESEWALAQRLLTHVPAGALLLADRLYGCTAFALEAQTVCARVGSHFLFRARTQIKGRVVKRLREGSRILAVPLSAKQRRTYHQSAFTVREIRVRVGRRGHRSTEIRLWTSLFDPKQAPALELAQLYARRWEHELYYREVKRQLRRNDLLQSHSVETGAQEIAAIVLASALLAVERTRIANGQLPVLRVSFPKMFEVMKAMWLTLLLGDGVLSDDHTNRILKRGYKRMQRFITPARRSRSCPRAVRQPVTGWPRLMKNESIEGPFEFTVV